eukprot:TRINITY_DN22533_c0_g2_i1.p1 TRINITY_DN22533_c0_g2~~TRINITY_DN22533_c0_g2_i1.p1  ORF type:complete len:245 (+),score=48.47 TRINITY_DN22533_c0_g2_i1:60-737(+)
MCIRDSLTSVLNSIKVSRRLQRGLPKSPDGKAKPTDKSIPTSISVQSIKKVQNGNDQIPMDSPREVCPGKKIAVATVTIDITSPSIHRERPGKDRKLITSLRTPLQRQNRSFTEDRPKDEVREEDLGLRVKFDDHRSPRSETEMDEISNRSAKIRAKKVHSGSTVAINLAGDNEVKSRVQNIFDERPRTQMLREQFADIFQTRKVSEKLLNLKTLKKPRCTSKNH